MPCGRSSWRWSCGPGSCRPAVLPGALAAAPPRADDRPGRRLGSGLGRRLGGGRPGWCLGASGSWPVPSAARRSGQQAPWQPPSSRRRASRHALRARPGLAVELFACAAAVLAALLRLRLTLLAAFLAARRPPAPPTSGLARAELQPHRLLAPDLLEVVVVADGRLHDVGDGRAAVHDDPLAVFLALDPRLGKAGLAHRIAHAGGQRLGLPVGGARGHDHALEQRREVLGVENLDVLRLHVLQSIDDGALESLGVFLRAAGLGHQVFE